MTSKPITPKGYEPRDLSGTLGRRPRPAEPQPAPTDTAQPPEAEPAEPTPTAAAIEDADTGPTGPAAAPDGRLFAEATPPLRPAPARSEPPSPPRPNPPVAPSTAAAGKGQGRAKPPEDRRTQHSVFYLPLELSDRLRELGRRDNKTNADVIFDAIEANFDELPRLLSAEPAPDDGGVFTRPKARPVGQKVQVTARIRNDNLRIIDQLVGQHGAESRSRLVEVALHAYLTEHAGSPTA